MAIIKNVEKKWRRSPFPQKPGPTFHSVRFSRFPPVFFPFLETNGGTTSPPRWFDSYPNNCLRFDKNVASPGRVLFFLGPFSNSLSSQKCDGVIPTLYVGFALTSVPTLVRIFLFAFSLTPFSSAHNYLSKPFPSLKSFHVCFTPRRLQF